MTFILLTLWNLTLARSLAITTDCSSLLTPKSDEVLVRGILRESTSSTNGPTWSVWIEALDENLVVSPGDRLYILDDAGKIALTGGTFEYVRTVLGWDAGRGGKRMPLRRPRLRASGGEFVGPEFVKIAIETRAPVVLLKACNAETRVLLAEENRRAVEIAPGFELPLRPDEIVITGELRLTFEDEMRHTIDYASTGYTPPRLHQGMILAVGSERSGFAPVRNGDLVILIDKDEKILSKARQLNVERKLTAPFTAEQLAWAEALARTRRVAIVRRT